MSKPKGERRRAKRRQLHRARLAAHANLGKYVDIHGNVVPECIGCGEPVSSVATDVAFLRGKAVSVCGFCADDGWEDESGQRWEVEGLDIIQVQD